MSSRRKSKIKIPRTSSRPSIIIGLRPPSSSRDSSRTSSKPPSNAIFNPAPEPTAFPQTAIGTARIPTEQAPLGDPERTVLEGLKPNSGYESIYPATAAPPPTRSQRPPPPAPSFAKNTIKDPEDAKMASRQSQYASLTPSEQVKQDSWAGKQMALSGTCPDNWTWERCKEGYICHGRHHLFTDELITQGRGGVLVLPGGLERQGEQWGPYYKDPDTGKLTFGGNKSDFAPEWVELTTGKFFWPDIWRRIPGMQGLPSKEQKRLLEPIVSQIWNRIMYVTDLQPDGLLTIKKDRRVDPNRRSSGSGSALSSWAASGSGSGSGSAYQGASAGKRLSAGASQQALSALNKLFPNKQNKSA